MYIFPVINKQVVGLPKKVKAGATDVILELFATGGIKVDVKDVEGKPIENAHVRVMYSGENSSNKNKSTKTDKLGRAIIENAPIGNCKVDIFRVSGKITSYPRPSMKTIIVKGKMSTASLVFKPVKKEKQDVFKLKGKLVDEKGKPIRHACLTACYFAGRKVKPKYHSGIYRGSSWTMVDGNIEMDLNYDNLMRGKTKSRPFSSLEVPEKPGLIAFTIKLDGYNKNLLKKTVEWPKGKKEIDLGTLKVKLPVEHILVIQGKRQGGGEAQCWVERCVDDKGREIPFRSISNPQGAKKEFKIAVRNSGIFNVQLKDKLGNAVTVKIAPGVKKQEASFPKARECEFTVTDDTGKPIQGASLYTRSSGNSPWTIPYGWTERNGKAKLQISPKASGTFYVRHKEYCPVIGEIEPGKTPLKQTFRLKPLDAEILGIVVDEKGKPLTTANLNINLSLGEFHLIEGADIQKDGTFRIKVPSNMEIKIRGFEMGGDPLEYREGVTKTLKPTSGQKLKTKLVLKRR